MQTSNKHGEFNSLFIHSKKFKNIMLEAIIKKQKKIREKFISPPPPKKKKSREENKCDFPMIINHKQLYKPCENFKFIPNCMQEKTQIKKISLYGRKNSIKSVQEYQ